MLLHPFGSCSVFVSIGILILTRKNIGECNPITNTNFNENIREFSLKEDNVNTTEVKTLQREDPKKYADLSHFRPMLLKDVSDNKISGSSQSRGLISRDQAGYHIHDYEEYPHSFGYDYHLPHGNHEYDHHDFEPYYGHHGSGHHYVGPHYKHYNHALSAKAVLWPIAGIALLGAAAALVSNPILLQLGVATGKRRRRDTEEIIDPESMDFDIWNSKENLKHQLIHHKSHFLRKAVKNRNIIKKIVTTKTNTNPIESTDDFEFHTNNNESINNNNYVPVPIKLKRV